MDAASATLGRYRLIRLLGKGGMGEVHLASAHGAAGFEKLVAIKILRAGFRDDPRRTHELLREALIGVRLDHEHIVQVLDFDEEAGRYYIAMEYVRGHSLAHVLDHLAKQGRALPIRCAVHIARAVANALDHVHNLRDAGGKRLGVIHGDVSPSNILLGADGRIKLSDFGVAALEDDRAQVHRVVGKLAYLPPEAFSGAPRAAGWDIYAAGAVLYRAVSSRIAFPGESYEAIRAAMERGAAPLAELRPDCPAALAKVIEMAIDRRPSVRFRSGAELRAALDEAVPRQVNDADVHRAYLAALYEAPAFVRTHGELPTTASASTSVDVVPAMEETEAETLAVRRPRPLRVGLSPAHGPDVARQHGRRLADALAPLLERDVRTAVFADYKSLIECLATGEVDIAWMPPVPFIEAADRGAGLVVVARRYRRTSYESAIIVREDSAIESVGDLRGRSIAWVDRQSAGGYLGALAEIVRRLGAPDPALGPQHFHGSHRAVCEAVANGWADAGATYAVRAPNGRVMASAWADLLGERAQDVRPIAFCGPIPGDTIAHRPSLPGKLLEELVKVFTGLASKRSGRELLRDIFGADALVSRDMDKYNRFREAIEVVRRYI